MSQQMNARTEASQFGGNLKDVRINRQEVEAADKARKPRKPYRISLHMAGWKKDGDDWAKLGLSDSEAAAAVNEAATILQ